MKQQTKAYFYALSAVLLWSTVATAFKLALTELKPEILVLLSSFVAALSLFIILVLTGKTYLIKEQSLKQIIVSVAAGLLNPFLYYLVLFKAYDILPAQTALALNYSWAVMIVVFSSIFLKQKISFLGMGAILISFLGLLIIATKGNFYSLEFDRPIGTVVAFGSSLIWAAFWIVNIKDKRDEILKLFQSFSFGLLFIIFYLFISGFTPFSLTIKGGLSAAYIGLFEMGITFFVWLKALKLSKNTAKVSSLIFLAPFISLNFINIILGEKILLSTVIGITLIVGGILLQKKIND